MKKSIGIIILAGSILLALTACSDYEPLISRDGAAMGSAVSGNSVTSVVSGGAVEGNHRDRQDKGNGEKSGELKADSQWSKWYRNCNSNKAYRTTYAERGDVFHLEQLDLNGKEKKKTFEIKVDELLWVTDEWICLTFENKVYRIPLKHGEGQKESLDTENKECIISDLLYDDSMIDPPLCVMDENDIYYLNKDEKLIAYHISDKTNKEIKISKNAELLSLGAECHMTNEKVFILADEEALYCIQRDTFEAERIFSCDKDSYLDGYFTYMEETGELYFICLSDDYYGVCDLELYVYDGNTTRCVVSKKEMNDMLCKQWKISEKAKKYAYFESYNVYSDDGKIYIEYMIDDANEEDHCGVMVCERSGKIYEEEGLEKQIKKHFDKKDDYYYNVYDVREGLMYVANNLYGKKATSYSYNLQTGEMEKVPVRVMKLVDICGQYNTFQFAD